MPTSIYDDDEDLIGYDTGNSYSTNSLDDYYDDDYEADY